MRWGLLSDVVLLLLVAAYASSPLLGFYRIGSAIGGKDKAAFAEPVRSIFECRSTSLFPEQGSAKDGLQVSAVNAPFSGSSLRNAWEMWRHSEFGLGNCSAFLPPEKSRDQQLNCLRNWRWKLTGLGIPDNLRVRLARDSTT
jgi:hypothetical protein